MAASNDGRGELAVTPHLAADGPIRGRDDVVGVCPCGRRFRGLSAYAAHLERHHPDTEL